MARFCPYFEPFTKLMSDFFSKSWTSLPVAWFNFRLGHCIKHVAIVSTFTWKLSQVFSILANGWILARLNKQMVHSVALAASLIERSKHLLITHFFLIHSWFNLDPVLHTLGHKNVQNWDHPLLLTSVEILATTCRDLFVSKCWMSISCTLGNQRRETIRKASHSNPDRWTVNLSVR